MQGTMQFGFERLSILLVLALTGYLSPSCASETNDHSGITISYLDPVTAGVRTNFTCSSTCIPQCTYVWVLKDRTVEGSMLFWIPDGLESSVDLQCTAVNPESGQSETSTVTVEVENPFSVQLGSGYFFPTVNQPFTLICGGATREHEVAWYKDGQALTPDSRTELLAGNATLRFSSLLPSDGGFYRCTGLNENVAFSLGYLLNFEPWAVSISGPDTVQPDSQTTFICLVNCTISVDCFISWRFKGGFPSGSLSIRGRTFKWTPFTPRTFQNLTCVVESVEKNGATQRSAEGFKTVEVLDMPVYPTAPVSGSDVVKLSTMLVMVCCLGLQFLFDS
ncbi:hemicentin-1-like [Osmerus eperlanus]|uniref:hemicentin-1-like n=1 Tax=Osmerus eperlanus TaxID=29151 RepID=UPI002E168807